jgi:hypothetical protein
MFFSGGYVENDRQRVPQCSSEENDILRELLLESDFASPRHPLPSSTRHLALNKRTPHHLELSLPQICFDSMHTPLGRFQSPLSLQSRFNPSSLSSPQLHTPGGSSSSSSSSLPPSIMSAIISPPRVFIQEFARLPPPFFQDQHMSETDDARSTKPIISCLPPAPLPMLSMPPLKKKKTQSHQHIGASASSSSSSSISAFPSSTNNSMNADRKQMRCSYPDCPNLRRSAGFCNRHSGKVCSVHGCHKSALSRGKCPEHGGGSRCKRDGCDKFAQTRGLCKSHGGGRQCNVAGCDKNAHQNRLCRSHGGGKRCDFYGCPKWAQRSGYCCAHTKMGSSQSSQSQSGLPSLSLGATLSSSSSSSSLLSSMPPPMLSPPLLSPHRLLSLLP